MINSVKDYQPTEESTQFLQKIRPLFLVGPSGSGKDTLQNALLKTNFFHKVITYTTRAPRINHGQIEKEGGDYFFIDEPTAKQMMDEKKFIEVAIIHGNFYGNDFNEFERALSEQRTPIEDIDVKGVESYSKLSSNFIAIFLLPESFDLLKRRLLKRYGDSIDKRDFTERLKTALFELQSLFKTDYYHVLINSNVDKTVEDALAIVDGTYDKERFAQSTKDLAKKIISDIETFLNSI